MKRRIRIGIPDGILNDYLKGMKNERAAYEIIRLATNNLQGFSDTVALRDAASSLVEPSNNQIKPYNPEKDSVKTMEHPPQKSKDVSFEEDLMVLS